MPPLRLITLGSLALVRPAGSPTATAHRRELLLLAYLASVSPRHVPREELASLLWGEREERRARQSLREALYHLRRVLGPALEVDPRRARLLPHAVELDALAFEADVAAGRLVEAVARWQGEFLCGTDETGGEEFTAWLHRERERLRGQLVWALERLASQAEEVGDWNAAVRWAGSAAELRPDDESAQLCLLRSLARAGRRVEAAARHKAFVVRLRDELSAECSPEFLLAGDRLGSDGMPGSAALLAPDFVGREAALVALSKASDDARAGRSSAVLIEGEEGIGKTRLVHEFLRRSRLSPERLLVLRVDSRDRGDPGPWLGVRCLLDPLRQEPSLGGASAEALGELSALAPWLRERYPHLPQPSRADDAVATALHEVLSTVAEERRVVVWADDFPTLGVCTRALFVAIARRPPAAVLLLMSAGSARDAVLPAEDHDEPVTIPRIRLQPLSVAEIDVLLASMLELHAQERSRLAVLLHDATDGVPLYVIELVSAMADSGLLVLDSGGTWRLAADLAEGPLPLPFSVREAVRERLNRLGGAARTLAEAAAVLGRQVDGALLEIVAKLAADDLADALAELITRRFLVPSSGPLPGYEFPHELLWRAVYDVIPAGRRRALHAAALAALDAAGAERGIGAPEREHHRAQAGSPSAGPAGRARPRQRSRRWLAAAATVMAAVAAIALWWIEAPEAMADGQSRLLVVGFVNETGDPSLDPLGNVSADWLTQGIAQLALVKVVPPAFTVSRGGSLLAAGDRANRELAQAREAQADIVVTGMYWKSADSIHFRARITDAKHVEVLTGLQHVSAPSARPLEAIERLRQSVVASLAPRLDPRMAASAGVQSAPPSYESYHAFATGLQLLFDRRAGALDNFLRAYALDTTYTLPLLYAGVVHDGTGQLASLDSLMQTLLPRRAELAPFDRHLLDVLARKIHGDRAGALSAARAMVDIAPGSILAVFYLAQSALWLNRPREASEALSAIDPERARIEGQGLTGYWSMLAGAYHMLGEYERQLEVGQIVRRELPEDVRYLFYEARALAALGRHQQLEAALQESLLRPTVPGWGAPGLWLHLTASDELRAHGDSARARAVLDRALRFYENASLELRNEAAHRFDIARALSRTGDLGEARHILERLGVEYPQGWRGVGEADLRAQIGYVAAAQGDTSAAREVDRWLAANNHPYHFGQSTEFRAGIAALLGRKNEAVQLLRRATAEGRPYDSGKHTAHEFHPLRGYPPFEEWMRPNG